MPKISGMSGKKLLKNIRNIIENRIKQTIEDLILVEFEYTDGSFILDIKEEIKPVNKQITNELFS